jgi:hypothetical protein|tara:strand:- start:15113 stop:15406 length:294 start_codon:yes stop_codon:yes gene_type:complete
MIRLEAMGGDVEIDADIVAKGLKMDVSRLRTDMQAGRVTCQCERGIEEDAGRMRITFYSKTCQYRLVVDDRGRIVQSSVVNFGRQGGGVAVRNKAKA